MTSDDPKALDVEGLTAETISELALAAGIGLHELTPRRASLEQAYMELTRDSVTYQEAATHHDRERTSR